MHCRLKFWTQNTCSDVVRVWNRYFCNNHICFLFKFTDAQPKESFICHFPNCSKIFSRRGRLKFHIQNSHLGEIENTKCDICYKHFASRKSKERHIELIHLGIKRFYCEECDRYFSTIALLEGHKRSKHGAKMLECSKCSAEFSYNAQLQCHIKKCQSNFMFLQKYKCSQCDLDYTEKRSLSAHIATKHQGRNSVCEICGTVFAYRSSYRKHMKRRH